MLNRIVLQGRLTKDPELRTTQAGLAVAKFSIAVDRSTKDKQTGDYETDFINCTAWRKTAEFVNRYFHKGDPIIVEGSLQNNNWADAQGIKHYENQVIASNAHFSGPAKQSRDESSQSKAAPEPQASPDISDVGLGQLGEYEEIISDEEVPF